MQKQYLLILLFLKLAISSLGQVNAPNGVTMPVPASGVNPSPIGYSSTIPKNYMRTWQVKKPLSDVSQVTSSAQVQDVFQSTDYSDGLGKPLQKVVRGTTPLGKDMVSPWEYDNAGREVYKYLSYPSATNDGKIKLNPFADQNGFMKGQYAGEQVFYNQTVFDNSPLSKIEKTMAAGNSFAGSGRGTDIKYEANGANEVRIWTINASVGSAPLVGGYYDAASLNRQITIDPQGKRVVEYKDKEGRVILKKVEIKHDGAADITGYIGWLSTYFVYDDVSNLRYTITPRAIEWLIAGGWQQLSTDIINELCFKYDYDDLGRMIVKKAPGAAEEYTIYDKKDRVIFSQDGNMRSQNQWLAIIYDKNDRQLMTGIISYSGNLLQLQSYADTHFDGNPNPLYRADLSFDLREIGRAEYKANRSIEFLPGFISEPSASFVAEIDLTRTVEQFAYGGVELPPGNNFTLLTQTYYDDYSWVSSANSGLPSGVNTSQLQGNWMNTAAANQYPYPLPVQMSSSTLDMKTGTKTRVLSNGSILYLYSVHFYDDYGNIIQVYSTNATSGYDIFSSQYGYGGQVLASHHKHFKGGTNSQAHDLYTRFVYDAAGRLTKTYKRINDQAEKLTSANTYNELSQLVKIELGDPALNNGKPLETLDYTYNLSGSLKGMNEAFTNGQTNDRFFGEILSRDYGFTQSQYNGNIAGAKWRSIGDGEQRAFGYAYDPANRLLKADFTQNNSGWNNSANIDFSMKLGDGIDPALAYDANGNIKAMRQKGLKLYQSEVIDDLTYKYLNNNYSNRLESVSDIAPGGTQTNTVENTLGDFKDNTAGTIDYDYDDNGNLIKDGNKSVSSIIYNYLNLPNTVQITNKGSISYLYNAAGERLQKVVQPISGTAVTYSYVGPFTYRDDKLQYIYTEDGRIRPTVSPSGVAGWAYDYFIKDHLGNIRMILTDEQRTDVNPKVTFEDGTAALVQQYYERTEVGLTPRPAPFGDNTTEGNGQKVQLLRKSSQSIGVGKLLKVMVKDKVNVTVDYYFPSETVDNNTANGINSLINILLPLLDGNSAPAALKGSGAVITQQLNVSDPLNNLLAPQNASSPGTLPKAYLNIIFFDEQMRFISQNSKIVPVSVGGSRQTINELYIEAPKNGYVYAYVSNESNNLVYFDNFKVSHTRGPVLEETHLYPFGSKMTAICSRALPGVQNSLSYQGKELDEEFDLDWFDFESRYYDPQTGRFVQSDPADQFASGYTGMGNNWINGTDPDGRIFGWDDAIAAGVGAIINVVSNLDNLTWGNVWGYAATGAAAGWAGWNTTLVAGPIAGAAVAGAITGVGNALTGGASIGAAIGQGIVGGATGMLGGILAGPVSGVISSKLSSVIGSTASGIVANITTSAAVGGAFGAGMSAMNGGSAWQGFVSGMRMGAITGAISSAVPAAINALIKPKPFVPKEVEVETVDQTPDVKTELQAPNYEFGKLNGAKHFLEHSRGLKDKKGEFVPIKGKKPDMPTTLKLSQYKEGAKALFKTDNGTSSFMGKDGKLYMYKASTNEFGVANPVSGKIITYYHPKTGYQYWIGKVIANQ